MAIHEIETAIDASVAATLAACRDDEGGRLRRQTLMTGGALSVPSVILGLIGWHFSGDVQDLQEAHRHELTAIRATLEKLTIQVDRTGRFAIDIERLERAMVGHGERGAHADSQRDHALLKQRVDSLEKRVGGD